MVYFRSRSRYRPRLLLLRHCEALSTAVFSPHSLNVVTSCQCALLRTIARTAAAHAVVLRPSNGWASPLRQKPGDIENEDAPTCSCRLAGPYACQLDG